MIKLVVDGLKLKKTVMAYTAVDEKVWFDIFAALKRNGGLLTVKRD
jgi:hypothetical protein